MFNIKDLINLRKINETKKKLVTINVKNNKMTKLGLKKNIKKVVQVKNKNLKKIVEKKKIEVKKNLNVKRRIIIKPKKLKGNKIFKVFKFNKKKFIKIAAINRKARNLVNKVAKKFVNYNARKVKKPGKKPGKNDVSVLVVANEYHGTPFPLSGCYNDANKFIAWITTVYPKADVTYLTDNPAIHNYNPKADADSPDRYPSFDSKTFPTHDIVYAALAKLIKSKSKLKFLYMSGHGATANDVPAPIESTLMDINPNGQLLSTMNASSLVNPNRRASYYFCNDYGAMSTASPLNDFEMFTLMKRVTAKQKMYIFTDCCHSGTLFNLPYVNVAEFMVKYDASGNIETEMATEKDDFGHTVYDGDGNPLLKKVAKFNSVIDLSNNVAKKPITMEDFNTLIADANTKISYFDNTTGKTREQAKINILSAEYPSNKKLKGNIIHISGTRDGTFSYESVIYDADFNIIDRAGAFTWSFRLLWNLGLQNFNLRDTYTALVGLINNPIQIPVCCTSKFNELNNPAFLTDLGPNASSLPYSIPRSFKSTNNRLLNVKKLNKKQNKKQKQKIINKKKVNNIKHKDNLKVLLMLKKNK